MSDDYLDDDTPPGEDLLEPDPVEHVPPGPDVLNEARQRYGSRCPACGSILGELPATGAGGLLVERPAFYLEVGEAAGDQRTWRLSVVGRPTASRRSYQPPFHPAAIEHTYLLCGNGHIFPFTVLVGPGARRFDVHYWNTIAAMGPVASGKTYLLTRMLDQGLVHHGLVHRGGREKPVDVRFYAGAPLEEYVHEQRRAQYDATLVTGRPISPTNTTSLAPYEILNTQVAPYIYDAVVELLQETVTPAMVNETRWGVNPPQPIMARTRVGDGQHARHGWTCVVDLAGEYFDPGQDGVGVRDRSALRGYNALVWVIDPVLEARVFDRFAKGPVEAQQPGSYTETLQGSLRAGTTSDDRSAPNYTDAVRAQRRRIQRAISQRITKLGGEFLADDYGRVRLLVAVSKVDLIQMALTKARLDDLGEDGQFGAGIVHYLHHVARNAGVSYQPDHECAELLRRIDAREVADEWVLNERLTELADALIDYYSDADRFWSLVEKGAEARVPLSPDQGPDGYYDGPVLRVPSIGEHLRQGLLPGRPDAAGRLGIDDPLLTRDLVMSALGCGMVFALGYGDTMLTLMSMPWIDLRLFLCSPLAAAPRVVTHEDEQLSPTMETLDAGEDFADTDTRSAALTQLLLRVLRRVL